MHEAHNRQGWAYCWLNNTQNFALKTVAICLSLHALVPGPPLLLLPLLLFPLLVLPLLLHTASDEKLVTLTKVHRSIVTAL